MYKAPFAGTVILNQTSVVPEEKPAAPPLPPVQEKGVGAKPEPVLVAPFVENVE